MENQLLSELIDNHHLHLQLARAILWDDDSEQLLIDWRESVEDEGIGYTEEEYLECIELIEGDRDSWQYELSTYYA